MKQQILGYGKRRLVDYIIKKSWGINNPESIYYNYNDVLYLIQETNEEGGKNFLQISPEESIGGFKVMKDLANMILSRALANYDTMVLMTANKGAGKSSAAMMLAKAYCKIMGIKFDPARHMAYSNADVSKKIDELNDFEPLIADESLNFISANEWNKAENKELKKKLGVVRTKHLFFILCYPMSISKVEKTYLDSFVNFWVDLYARGKGIVFIRDKNPVGDVWKLKDFEKKVGAYNEFTPPAQIKAKLEKHPNFWKMIKFPKPSKGLYSRYLKVRESNVYNRKEVFDSVTNEDRVKNFLLMAFKDLIDDTSALEVKRIIKHIHNRYGANLSKTAVDMAFKDSKQLCNRLIEEAENVRI